MSSAVVLDNNVTSATVLVSNDELPLIREILSTEMNFWLWVENVQLLKWTTGYNDVLERLFVYE